MVSKWTNMNKFVGDWPWGLKSVHGMVIRKGLQSMALPHLVVNRGIWISMKHCFIKIFTFTNTSPAFIGPHARCTMHFLLCLNTKFQILQSVQVQVHQSLLADQIKIAGLGRGYIGLGDWAIFMDTNVGSLKRSNKVVCSSTITQWIPSLLGICFLFVLYFKQIWPVRQGSTDCSFPDLRAH